MSAHSKVTRLGLGSVLVALAMALGGCSESVAGGPASVPASGPQFGDRNAVTLARFVAPHLESEPSVPEVKTASLVTHGVAKRTGAFAAIGH